MTVVAEKKVKRQQNKGVTPSASATTEYKTILAMIQDTNRRQLIRCFSVFSLLPGVAHDLKSLDKGVKYTVKFRSGWPPMMGFEQSVCESTVFLDFSTIEHYTPLWRLVDFWQRQGLSAFCLTVSVMDGSVYVTDAKVV